MANYVRTLGAVERASVWMSTLNNALYRWNVDTWEVKFPQAPEWHSVKAGAKVLTVYAQSSEKFVEVTE